MHFSLSLLVASFKINLPLRVLRKVIPIDSNSCRFLNQNQYILPYPNSPIVSSKGVKAILLTSCQLVEVVEKEGFEIVPVNLYSKKKDNDAFLN